MTIILSDEMKTHIDQITALTNSPVRSIENQFVCSKRVLAVLREIRRLNTDADNCWSAAPQANYRRMANELRDALYTAIKAEPLFVVEE